MLSNCLSQTLKNTDFFYYRSSKSDETTVFNYNLYIDPLIITEMKASFGYEFADVVRCVQRNKPGSILAIYHLLKTKKSKCGKFINETSKLLSIPTRNDQNLEECRKKLVMDEKIEHRRKIPDNASTKTPQENKESENAKEQNEKQLPNSNSQSDNIKNSSFSEHKLLPETVLLNRKKEAEKIKKRKDLEQLILKVALMAKSSSQKIQNKRSDSTNAQRIDEKIAANSRRSSLQNQDADNHFQPKQPIQSPQCQRTNPNSRVLKPRGTEPLGKKTESVLPLLSNKKVHDHSVDENASSKLNLRPLTRRRAYEAKLKSKPTKFTASKLGKKNFRQSCDFPSKNYRIQKDYSETRILEDIKRNAESSEDLEKSRRLPALGPSPNPPQYKVLSSAARGELHQKHRIRHFEDANKPTPVLLSQKWRKIYGEKSVGFLTKYNNYVKNYSEKPSPVKSKPKKIISEPIANVIACFVSAKQRTHQKSTRTVL